MGFARSLGFNQLVVANLFAYRATLPAELKRAAAPIGPDNDCWLKRLHQSADLTLVAWGNDGAFWDRDRQVLAQLSEPQCLALNCSGRPAHPLYLPASARPFPFPTPT
ncbi:hypothetical protein GCM10023333_41090 [Ferrimonas pelagia]|uniref:DUF1643 domain-containing protein n=2 Tax=Ferrimonas pelagia TaxID=1177826 RepID=A0ABP9FKB6_9GAMM